MTYVSRRARIIAPRWPNENDTDFLFRTRRRCDGRLKRHSSSLDLRAWINNSCIKYEYLLELMSDGEVTLTPPFQLYGRFIPVPLLFKLMQSTAYKEKPVEDEEQKAAPLMNEVGSDAEIDFNVMQDTGEVLLRSGNIENHYSTTETAEFDLAHNEAANIEQPNESCAEKLPESDARPESDSQDSLSRVLWEKDVMEKNLFKSTCLLTKALGKLEKIDSIIQVANEETEHMRREEIQEAFRKTKMNCCCGQNGQNCASESFGGWNSKNKEGAEDPQRLRDGNKCNELLRQISNLREKLKKNQEHQQKVNLQIGKFRRRSGSSTSTPTDGTCAREGPELKRLEKKLERLVNEKGKLLSQMFQALKSLKNLKKCTSSQTTFAWTVSRSDYSHDDFPADQQESSICDCTNCQSYDTETVPCSDAQPSEDDHHGSYPYYDYSTADNLHSGQETDLHEDQWYNSGRHLEQNEDENVLNDDHLREKEGWNSKHKFICEPCKRKLDAKPSCCGGRLSSEQFTNDGGVFGDCFCRPSTSPTTGQERRKSWVVRCCFSKKPSPACQDIRGRRVKSETTMKEIEKTLRNYEQRLSDMDGLEYKVEEWKRKLMEACRWSRNMSKVEASFRMERDAERERSSREIHGLFSENRVLKKQVRELMDQSKEQAQKIRNLKCGIMKTRDLETETEELKKELSEYRDCYEHQRKCISKWESVVAVQRKEIENLMNHIRKLTTKMKEQMSGGFSDRRHGHRSRSYSPEVLVESDDVEGTKPFEPFEENGSCCCQDFRQSESRRIQQKCVDRNYSSVSGMEDL